jgi:1,4-alpha-glucan branching enzyme
VRFSLAASAGQVSLVGDFNNWDPAAQPLRRRDGAWSVTLHLPPGRYRYAFVVDGDLWYNDPGHPVAQDEFGTPTSVITVAN